MIIDCPICGKLTCIHWPQFWPYVRGTAYYCSWTCMDVSLCRDMNLIKAADMRKRSKKNMKTIVTKEQKQKAVSMAIDGRDPRPYLKECGSSNPDNLWWYIKSTLKKNNPELYAKVMDMRKTEKKPEEVPVVKVDGALRIETPEAKKIQVAEMPKVKVEGPVHVEMPDAPIMLDEFQVTAIRSDKYGEFYYDKDHNCIDWRNGYGDEVSLTPGGWADLAEDLPKILRALGVGV